MRLAKQNVGLTFPGLASLACVAFASAQLAGCNSSATQPLQHSSAEVSATGLTPAGVTPQSAITDQPIQVTLTEGTNMAAALNGSADAFVLSLQGTLFKLPADGGTATAITDYYQDAREPQFSPDGSQVVYQGYANGNWDISALDLSDFSVEQPSGALAQPRALTTGPFDDREPVFSPDGNQVAFSSDRSGNYDIWLLTIASGELRQITTTPADDYSPSFSADGTQILFARHTKPTQSELQLMNLQQGTSAAVASENGIISGVSVNPKPDPASNFVTYQLLTRNRNGQTKTELRLLDLGAPTGATAITLSAAGADVFPFRASWSALEKGVLYATIDGQLQRYDLNADKLPGHGAKHAAKAPPAIIPFEATVELNRPGYKRRQRSYATDSRQALGIVAPALSHAGGRIAFTALGDLWQWNLLDDELLQLTDDAFAEFSPSYSPDGKYIAYVSDRGGSPQLWLHNLIDGTQRRLDANVTGVSYPSWSPDGKHLAYFGALPGDPIGGQLMIAELATGTSRGVGAPTPPQPLSWSSDSQHLAATVLAPYSRRYREGVYELLVFNTQGEETARINLQPHLSPFDARLTPDGKAVGYVQGGALWYQLIDANFKTSGAPRKLGEQLSDMPAWSGNGREVVVLSGDSLQRINVATGATINSYTVPLDYSPQRGEGRWTLRSERLFDGVSANYQLGMDIVINDNRIEAITPHSASSPEPIIAAGTVIPGLFEMHAHMGNRSEAQGRTWLAYGITTVRDPGSNPYLAKERQESWDSGRLPGPRTHITGYLTDGNRVYYSIAESLTRETLDRALARTEKLQLDFIKTYVRLPDDLQRDVVTFAHNLGIPTSSHELFPAAAYGSDHVEHIGGTSRRGYQPKVSSLGHSYADVVELLAASNMGITATAVLPGWAVIYAEDQDLFTTNTFQTFYGPEVLKGYEGLARRYGDGAKSVLAANGRLLRALVERDALLVTGTDSPFVPYGAGLHAELRLYERSGLAPWQVLRAATAKSAEASGVGRELGSIAPGMLADMVVIDGDPLSSIKDADNVVMTIKGGQRFPIEALLQEPAAN